MKDNFASTETGTGHAKHHANIFWVHCRSQNKMDINRLILKENTTIGNNKKNYKV